jgi:hypothetical protein
MNMDMLKQVFTTPDGKQFDTKAEALDYLRKPKVLQALNSVTNSNAELNEFLYNNQEALEDVFQAGTVQRVSKAERKALDKALEAVKASGNKNFEFIAVNADAIAASFKWPTVARVPEEAKEALITAELMKITDNDADLADWIKASKDAIFASFEAGKLKRADPPAAATDALAHYRAQMAELKVLKDTAAALTKEGKDATAANKAVADYTQMMADEKAARDAAKAAAKAAEKK